jgi:hypothetical protein
MKKLLVVLALLGIPTLALAQSPVRLENCRDLDTTSAPAIDAGVLTSTQTFTFTQANSTSERGSWGTMEVFFTLVDANASITRLDLTCTGSRTDNSTDTTPLDCSSVASGIATCVPTGVFRTAVSGSGLYHLPIDISRVPDIECSFTVGAGAATAVSDVISVWRRVCSE